MLRGEAGTEGTMMMVGGKPASLSISDPVY
jgi:hypothetical protein